MDFPYGEAEIAHLRTRDPKLGAAIDRIGPIHREVDPDLFSSVLHHIIGQQVSMAAQRTVWQRLQTAAAPLSPETVAAMSVESLQALGMTYRRASYILEFARKVASGAFDLKALAEMEDSQVLAQLTSLRGVGPWTAEMLLIDLRPPTAGRGQLGRPGHPPGHADAVPEADHRPGLFPAPAEAVQPLRNYRQPVSLGHRLRRPAGADGPGRQAGAGEKARCGP